LGGPWHSQEGLRPGRELIGDRGIESIGNLDIKKDETPKTPKLSSGKTIVMSRKLGRCMKDPWIRDWQFATASFGDSHY
jgi:hypothetical protein